MPAAVSACMLSTCARMSKDLSNWGALASGWEPSAEGARDRDSPVPVECVTLPPLCAMSPCSVPQTQAALALATARAQAPSDKGRGAQSLPSSSLLLLAVRSVHLPSPLLKASGYK